MRVIATGLHTRGVDPGRVGRRAQGIAGGGAADRWAYQLCNALLGNEPDSVALEFTLLGPTLLATEPLAAVVGGAPFEVFLNQSRQDIGQTFNLQAGDVLRIGGTQHGCRGYLGVAGGFDRCLSNNTVSEGASLATAPSARRARSAPEAWDTWRRSPVQLHVLPGAQADWCDEAGFYRELWMVSATSNRMGLRLLGVPVRKADREMTSEPVAVGTVQLANDGRPIVLGVDGQTIGGYPKIAQVIRADVDRLGQLRPHDQVQFVRVSLNDAEDRARTQQRHREQWLLRLDASCPFP